MKKVITALTTVFLLALSNLVPSSAATNHQNGQIRLKWSTSNMFLNSDSYIEHEFIPNSTDAFVDGAQFRWSNQHQLVFCWEGTGKLTSPGNRCGLVGVGLGSKNGSNYYGNFDFSIWNATNYSILKNDSTVYCDKAQDGGYIDNVQTFHIGCWKGVSIQMGTPYVMRVQWDSTNTANDNNWWSATLTNKKTNESIAIGRIKAYGNSYQDQVPSLETSITYIGDSVACNQVPIIDLKVFPPKSALVQGMYVSQTVASCVRAKAFPSKELPGYYSIRLGGSNPDSREPGIDPQAEATPSPSSTTITTKPVAQAKPVAPVFTGIKISGNTLNINVNLNSSKPDVVYMIAPKLTGQTSQKILGEIDGEIASWSIEFDPQKIKGSIPISFVSVKDGETSEVTKIEYLLPNSTQTLKTVEKNPLPPSKISSRVVGEDLIVTAKIVSTGTAAATSVFLYSNVLGISKNKPIKGDLLNNSVVFAIPITPGVLSKKIDLNLFATNKIGASKIATSNYSLPIPKSQSFKLNNQKLETVICVKGPTVRTFASKTCPPGWQSK